MNIVGYKSPFKKKLSPMKAVDPATAVAIAGGAASIIGSLFGRRRRRREQRAARKQMEQARNAFMGIEYTNPYANLTNPYANLTNPYAENVYEDLTVDTRSADYLRQQQQQGQADLLQRLRPVAGGAGIAGLAQSISNITNQQARETSLELAKQERENKMMKLQGDQQRRTGEFEVEKMKKVGQANLEQLQAQGEILRTEQENQRLASLYGLSIDRKGSADRARQQARSQFISGLGQIGGGLMSHYGPGGMGSGHFGDDMFKLRTGVYNTFDRFRRSFRR